MWSEPAYSICRRRRLAQLDGVAVGQCALFAEALRSEYLDAMQAADANALKLQLQDTIRQRRLSVSILAQYVRCRHQHPPRTT
jgi:hypothetical protein